MFTQFDCQPSSTNCRNCQIHTQTV